MRTRALRAQTGMTLLEVMVAAAIIAILAAFALPGMTRWSQDQRVKAAARSASDLLLMARGEAVRSGRNHIVCFVADAAAAPIVDFAGTPMPGLFLRDDDGTGPLPAPNGVIDANEPRVFLQPIPNVQFGVTNATAPATGDPDPNGTFNVTGVTFQNAGGAAARCVVFRPDGVPRAYSIGVYAEGAVGTGAGAVYVTNGRRDYAVVLSPLGSVRVNAWDVANARWRN